MNQTKQRKLILIPMHATHDIADVVFILSQDDEGGSEILFASAAKQSTESVPAFWRRVEQIIHTLPEQDYNIEDDDDYLIGVWN